MNLIGLDVLLSFGVKHNQAKKPLAAWQAIAEQAIWQDLTRVRENYPHADGDIKGAYTVFNIKGNSYRLVTIIDYAEQTILITDVFTHAEYDKWSKA